MSLAELRGDIVILGCAVSAGIHGALVPEHFDEGAGAGSGFAAATGAAAVFGALIVSYALAVTTGLPVLHPDPEPVEGLALATKAIEAVGVLAASSLLARPARHDPHATERNATTGLAMPART